MPKVYKSFVAVPRFALSKDGEILDIDHVLHKLAHDVNDISGYATFVARNDQFLFEHLEDVAHIKQPASAGRTLGVSFPDYLRVRRTGASRKEELFRHGAVTTARSWAERRKATAGDVEHQSAGYKRTANSNAPTYGNPSINLGSVDKQYAHIEWFTENELCLNLVINETWHKLVFDFDTNRFAGFTKVCLPVVHLKNGVPVFSFPVEFESPVHQFSGDYVIGVDVGKANYVTASVVNQKTGAIVHTTTLSQRVHSLYNSVRASAKQVKTLRVVAENNRFNKQTVMRALDEASLQRSATMRKRRELAILAGQELADLSAVFDNAVVVFEDLTWVKNTMENGRWNIGALFTWTNHYLNQNGGWAVKVSAYKTSQVCHKCGVQGKIRGWHTFVCAEHGCFDRDVNASVNICLRAVTRVVKARATRSRNKKLKPGVARNTPRTRTTLKHPGRTKNRATPKQQKTRKTKYCMEVKTTMHPATSNIATVVADGTLAGTLTSGAKHSNQSNPWRI